MKRFLFMLLACFLLLSAALAGAEDAEEPSSSPYEPIPWEENASPYAPNKEGFLPDNGGYHDETIDVRIESFRHLDTTVMAVYVDIVDPSQLRTKLADRYPKQTTKRVSDIVKGTNAVLAINGDYFNYHAQGIVVRNTKHYRMNPNIGRDTLIIDENADFHIISPTTQEAFDAFEQEHTVVHAFCFGPGLVIDGEALTDFEAITMDCGKNKQTQRIVIGQLAPLSYLILTCEGPENKDSVGLTLEEMTQLCKEMGMVNAYNLDGGSSSTVVMQGKKINATSSKKIRSVGDAIWFATLSDGTP